MEFEGAAQRTQFYNFNRGKDTPAREVREAMVHADEEAVEGLADLASMFKAKVVGRG